MQTVSEKDLTPWFPADVKPVRKGFYQRKYLRDYLTAIPDFWTGKVWVMYDSSGNLIGDAINRKEWRGLIKNPKATK